MRKDSVVAHPKRRASTTLVRMDRTEPALGVPAGDQRHSPPNRATATLALLALGVVYGDIGTSPLYAAKETFNPIHGIPLNAENILGGISAIFWSLMIVVSLKYVTLVVRANNRGEGGIMALLALATSSVRDRPRLQRWLLAIGVFGTALGRCHIVETTGESCRLQDAKRRRRASLIPAT